MGDIKSDNNSTPSLKGKSLFDYWANTNNAMFLMTWAVAEGKFNSKEYNIAKQKDLGK